MKRQRKKKHGVLKVLRRIVLALVLIVALFFGAVTALEYRPNDTDALDVSGSAVTALKEGDSLTVMTWNIGFGALGDNADFFMDGGTMVYPSDKERVQDNMTGIINAISDVDPDLLYVQEADISSWRSHNINQTKLLQEALPDTENAFATNFKVAFLPYPIPPMGKIHSGIMTFSNYHIGTATRVSLPNPYSWPVRCVNLKRCLLVSRIPIKGSDKELVSVNLHLEAYDDGEGKIAQTKMLKEILSEEAKKGNYVIAGGDFNQVFSNIDTSAYPTYEGNWQPGSVDAEEFADDFDLLMDNTNPSCRSLIEPYKDADKTDFQYYLIDGYIVSKNLTVNSLETRNLDFVNTDHNPVVMNVTLN